MKKNRKKKKKNDLLGGYEDLFKEKVKVCQACGGEIKLERVNLEEFEGGKLYLMESVPAYVCENCGETWVPEPILKEFEKMIEITKAKRKPHQTKRRKRRN